MMHRAIAVSFAACVAWAGLGVEAWGRQTPSSSGAVARLDTPVLRIPRTADGPKIDGQLGENEWQDASALSAFWYDFTISNFRFLAADETQVELYAAYDRDNLYLAYISATYPPGSWLRARGRFPDVRSHPNYGLQWDDHIELELRPYPDNRKGFRKGLFKWFVNPIDTVFDQWWSIDRGEGKRFKSRMRARSGVLDDKWVLEMSIPLEAFRHGHYAKTGADGRPVVELPPDGTAWRAWFTRGIGGNMTYFNVFDNHAWNTTKTKLIFDADAPSFQVRSLGPIMKDVIDLTLEVKNHSERSHTVQLGFFVESAEGVIYSSYDAPGLKEGQLELTPGERKVINLRQAFPGITREGNVLWFDVRQAGQPAKSLFRTRLIDFHSFDGGELSGQSFRDRRLEKIAEKRPPKKDFDFRYDFSPYKERVSAMVDIGIHGASKEARTATEARVMVRTADVEERVVAEGRASFQGNFATLLIDAPDVAPGEQYKLSVLLFDRNRMIVGQTETEPFDYERPQEWFGNKIGLNDVVWAPYTAIEKTDEGFDLLKHRYTIAESGLPAQIYVKPETRDLTLEMRQGKAEPDEAFLVERGRGPMLRAPMRLIATVDGEEVEARVVEPAKVVRQWKSEIEYQSKLKVGPADVTLNVQYDCDGSIQASMTYGSGGSAVIDKLEMVADVRGTVDMVAPTIQGGGMAGADVWETSLPTDPGVVWDSGTVEPAELFYSRFVPFIYFGSADKGFSWWADHDKHWMLDKNGSAMRLVRQDDGQVSWHVTFVNNRSDLEGERTLEFGIQPHPAKPKPDDYREIAWHYRGDQWAWGYQTEPVELTDQYLKGMVHHATGAPRDWDYAKVVEAWDYPMPPRRYGRWRNVGIDPETGRRFEERGIYWLSKQIRLGRRTGWWWDEYWPTGFARTDNVAEGDAYFRDPSEVDAKELAWQEGFTLSNMRGIFKRLARVFAEEGVPQRQFMWANSQGTFLESTSWDVQLVEGAGAAHASYDIDIVTAYPTSLWRYLSKHFGGNIARIVADAGLVSPGDDPRLERQIFGRSLLHDIGFCPTGPHGHIQQRTMGANIMTALAAFDFFDDEMTEFIPYWRNEGVVRFGGESGSNLSNAALVSMFRRPLDDGEGYKVLFVVMNESFDPLEATLSVPAMEALVGGANTVTVGRARGGVEPAAPFAGLWRELAKRDADHPALIDLETGRPVASVAKDNDEEYGPIYIPDHDFVLLYAEHR